MPIDCKCTCGIDRAQLDDLDWALHALLKLLHDIEDYSPNPFGDLLEEWKSRARV